MRQEMNQVGSFKQLSVFLHHTITCILEVTLYFNAITRMVQEHRGQFRSIKPRCLLLHTTQDIRCSLKPKGKAFLKAHRSQQGGGTAQLRLGLEPTVFSLKSHTWSQNLMKLRPFMSCHRKNSVRYKVIGQSGFIQRDTHSIDRMQMSQKVRVALGLGPLGN